MDQSFRTEMAHRHGLAAGATGTGDMLTTADGRKTLRSGFGTLFGK